MPTTSVNGAEICYEESGSGSPLILSPGGLQGGLASYRMVIDKLSRAHRVIAYDRRFGGLSNAALTVQTWNMVCEDVIGLMDALDIKQAYLGGGSFGAAISLRCAALYPARVKAIFPSNIAGGLICNANLACRLQKSLELAMSQGIKAVIDAFNKDDRFGPFSPERAQYDPTYRKNLEAMDPQDFAQIMRDTIYALFDGPYISLGMTAEMLMGIRVPAMIMPGHNDVHFASVAQQVHRLVPNCVWAEVPPHEEAPEAYVQRVLQFLSATASARPHTT